METIPGEGSPEPIPPSLKSPEEDEATSQLMTKDPLLEQIRKMVLERLQELEGNKLKIIEHCLSLPKILRRILEQFSNKDLIALSLVNKLWNYEARSLLRDRGCLRAAIKREPICESLVDFASGLRKMSVVPFNGIHLKINHSSDHRNFCTTLPIGLGLHPAYKDILDRLPWKHLSIEFYDHRWKSNYNCPAIVLIHQILQDYRGVLEELSFSYVDTKEADFVQSILQKWSFPCLKILKVQGTASDTSFREGFIKALLSHAPNLQQLYIHGWIKIEKNVMAGSAAVLVAASGLHLLDVEVCESIISALRTPTIYVYRSRDGDLDVELLSRIVPMLIQASRSTLKTVRMDLLFALPLMCYGICLENVTTLEILVTDRRLEGIQANILTLVKSLDYTRLFPKLKQVNALDWSGRDFSLEDISAFVGRGNAVAKEALADRAINIKRLELNGSLGKLTAMLLTEMFPHVAEISVQAKKEFPFALLWEHFEGLVEVHVDLNYTRKIENLDSVFCGIFSEEVAELREKDEEYLMAVNIVPVMPSITCLKGLKSLIFYHSVPSALRRFVFNETQVLFTKVADMLVFQRSEGLAVTLIMDRGNSKVSHKKPDEPVLPVGSPRPWYIMYS